MRSATANAYANIALIKYWGKRDETLFLPTKSSLSITLPDLKTTTTIALSREKNDTIVINKKAPAGASRQKIVNFLELFRMIYGIRDHFSIVSHNSFPTAAGVASSASGFAALTKGLNKLYKLNLTIDELSNLARRGSGSACRSLYEGFVLWHRQGHTQQLFDQHHWPELHVEVVVLDDREKTVSSRIAMQQTVATSPLYAEWIIESEKRIPSMIEAIKNKDIHALGTLAEKDCLEMHRCIQTAHPSINYLQKKTKQVIERVKKIRDTGVPCYFTIDAGPNVKIITVKKKWQGHLLTPVKNPKTRD